MISMPEIGSVVRVVTKFPNTYYYSDAEYEYKTFTGRIIRPESWMQGDEFNIETGNPKYPKSIIRLKNVSEIQYLSGSARKIEESVTRIFKITSKSSKKQYTVTVDGMRGRCDCLGFQFRKNCKHNDAVLKKIGVKK